MLQSNDNDSDRLRSNDNDSDNEFSSDADHGKSRGDISTSTKIINATTKKQMNIPISQNLQHL